MDHEEWDEDEELMMHLIVTIHQLQEFMKSEGFTQSDFEAYVETTSPRTLH